MVEDKEFEEWVIEGKEIAKKFLGLQIDTSADYETECGVAGRYNFNDDTACIYHKFTNYLSENANGIDQKQLAYHLVCHETSHAYDSRRCEEKVFFPYVIRVSSVGVMNIFGRYRLDIQPIQGLLSEFISSIFEYSVDKRIAEKLGFLDQTAKIRVIKSRDYLENPGDANEEQRRAVESALDLPTSIHDVNFGKIDNGEQKVRKECSLRYFGKKVWESTSDLLEEVAEASNLYSIIPKIFGYLFDLKADWRTEKKQAITNKLPAFWSKEEYAVLYIE